MRIVQLTVDNFMRLRAVAIKPDGTLQQITGRNAAGKSSVLNAIQAALGGKAATPDRPIRDGETSAQVVVDLGDIVVVRRWTSDDKSTLSVESKDGARHPSPQAMLDKLVGQLTFDPLAFVRSPAKEQATTLRKIAGVDTAALDADRKDAYDARTEANRVLKTEQARLAGMPDVAGPDEPVSVAALLEAQAQASDLKRKNEKARAFARQLYDSTTIKRKQVQDLEQELGAMRADLRQTEERAATAEARAAELQDPDVEAITQRIRGAEGINSTVRQRQARAAQREVVSAASDASARLTSKIDALDAHKHELLAAAKFPVPGLSVDGDTPTFNDIPLAQASSAEQIRVGLAVAAALNPKLRVVLVRDGSLLDADGLRLVAEWAAEHDMQVLCERVAGDSPVGIVIEDGSVVGAAGASEAA